MIVDDLTSDLIYTLPRANQCPTQVSNANTVVSSLECRYYRWVSMVSITGIAFSYIIREYRSPNGLKR